MLYVERFKVVVEKSITGKMGPSGHMWGGGGRGLTVVDQMLDVFLI